MWPEEYYDLYTNVQRIRAVILYSEGTVADKNRRITY
jgi:hypothetical protein